MSDTQSKSINAITITDIDMPFMSMVNFLAKLALAAIPAMLIVAIIIISIMAILSGLMPH